MMEEILKEIQKLVPEVLGVIVASDEGLFSSASAMMENVLREFKDNDFQLVFTSGEEYAILVGKVEGFYKERFAEMLKAYK